MKLTRLSVSILCAALLPAICPVIFPAFASDKPPSTPDDLKIDVQVDELGMMRVLLVFDAKSLDSAKVVEQRLSDSDFRVFVDNEAPDGLMSAESMKALGKKEQADLVFYAQSSSRLKNKLDDDFSLYEGEATVQVYSPVTGEIMATETTRAPGVRNSDDVEAERSAREKAIDTATKDVIVKMLEKAQKILVHEATITGVHNDNQLLAIMQYMGKMEGVYGVRQVSFDRAAHVGVIDIIGNPRSETYWRAYLEKMPKAQVIVKVSPNSGLRKKYPSWFDN